MKCKEKTMQCNDKICDEKKCDEKKCETEKCSPKLCSDGRVKYCAIIADGYKVSIKRGSGDMTILAPNCDKIITLKGFYIDEDITKYFQGEKCPETGMNVYDELCHGEVVKPRHDV